MTALGILWFILIGVLMVGYFVLDGFDLGVGVLYPFLAKTEDDRQVMMRAIGPVWDGNEVWLLTAGGALFAAFAPAYATTFSGFYLAIMLVLFGLILRAVSVEMRAHEEDSRKLWDAFFFVGSLLPALLFGVAIGNILCCLPLNANGDYTGTFFALLNPFSLLCGVLTLTYMVFQGASWTALKAGQDSKLRRRAAALRSKMGLVVAVVFVVVSAVYLLVVLPGATYNLGCAPLAAVAAVLLVACAFLVFVLCKADVAGKDLLAFLLASVGAALMVVVLFASMFPVIVPATDPALSLTIANSAATDATLKPMTIIACVGVPIMLVYHVIAYRAFRGRIG